MSDENLTCEHGRAKGHYSITDAEYPTCGTWCPGPVIATEPGTPVSDPTSELRERVEALRLSLSPGVTKPMPENGVWCQGYNQALDDVLSALGEKK